MYEIFKERLNKLQLTLARNIETKALLTEEEIISKFNKILAKFSRLLADVCKCSELNAVERGVLIITLRDEIDLIISTLYPESQE